MIDQFLARVFFNQWVVLAFTCVLFLGMAELGFRCRLFYRKRHPDLIGEANGGVLGSVLGLLALLLGFTFAMAVGRSENRNKLNVDEANSIGTTWLRSDFLPKPQRDEVRELLRKYVDLKRSGVEILARSREMDEHHAKVAEIHGRLWTLASTAATEVPSPISASFVSTLNETIDLDSSNLAALRNHVPGAVWLLLLIVASCGSWVSGYDTPATHRRSVFGVRIFPVLIAVVITLVSDIDRPHKGIIGISHDSMDALAESMQP